MDPLQVVTAVAGLTGTCLKSAMTLDGLREKFPGAGPTISTIARECGSISASLSDVQSAVLRSLGQDSQSELYPTFDTVVVGCMVVFACLEQDIRRTTLPVSNSNSRTPWRVKKIELSEAQLGIYLARIQDQEVAMRALAKLLQINVIDTIKSDIAKDAALFERIDSCTSILRNANPDINVRDSLFNSPADNAQAQEGVSQRTKTSIVDSNSYQRNRALSQIKATLAPVTQITAPPEGDLIDLGDEAASPTSGSTRLSPLESMWNMDAALPSSPEATTVSRGITMKDDAAFHTVRGPSSRDQDKTRKRPSRSSSRRAEKESSHAQELPSTDAARISSQKSIPISISPKLIRFSTPCEHEQAKSLPFTNTNPFPVTYKVSTTRPMSYAVRPNFGTLLPDQTVDMQFILMEALSGTEEELKRRDKFRIQSVPVEDVAHGSMFDWKSDKAGAKIEEVKIKVELVMMVDNLKTNEAQA